MKTHLCLILAVAAAAVCRSQAGSSPVVEWGALTNGIQLSIALRETDKQAQPDQLGDLIVRIRNASDHTIRVVRTGDPLTDISFQIRSPSGRNLSPKQRPYTGWARSVTDIKTNEVFSYPGIDLWSVCDLSEIGLYSIVVKQKVLSPSAEVTSNPLTFTLKATTRRKPPAVTNWFGKPGF